VAAEKIFAAPDTAVNSEISSDRDSSTQEAKPASLLDNIVKV
jgi:hypothetical protein